MAVEKGLDTASDIAHLAEKIKADGYEFVCRYLSTNNKSKNLGPEEAKALTEAGLWIVSVWENGFPTSAEYFSKSRGAQDGKGAIRCAKLAGQPTNTVIYAAVDFDAMPTDEVAVMAYLLAFDEVVKPASYHLGVYGSGAICALARARGIAKYAWLAQARGWRGYHDCQNPNIIQEGSITVEGVDCDADESFGNGGGWKTVL